MANQLDPYNKSVIENIAKGGGVQAQLRMGDRRVQDRQFKSQERRLAEQAALTRMMQERTLQQGQSQFDQTQEAALRQLELDNKIEEAKRAKEERELAATQKEEAEEAAGVDAYAQALLAPMHNTMGLFKADPVVQAIMNNPTLDPATKSKLIVEHFPTFEKQQTALKADTADPSEFFAGTGAANHALNTMAQNRFAVNGGNRAEAKQYALNALRTAETDRYTDPEGIFHEVTKAPLPFEAPPVPVDPEQQAWSDLLDAGRPPLEEEQVAPIEEAVEEGQERIPDGIGGELPKIEIDGPNLYADARKTAGVLPALIRVWNNTAGQLSEELVNEEVEQAGYEIANFSQKLVTEIVPNEKYPVNMVKDVRAMLNVLPKLISAPGALRTRMVALERILIRDYNRQIDGSWDTDLTKEERKELASNAAAIKDYIDQLNIPASKSLRIRGAEEGDPTWVIGGEKLTKEQLKNQADAIMANINTGD
jgi:hypothetical protein